MTGTVPVSAKRKHGQRGTQLMEVGLILLFFVPMFMGTFVTGFNIVRSIQVNHIVRDLCDMYIHGADFSTMPMQTIAQRLATGMGLEIGSFTGNEAANTGNGGRGLVTVTQLMYVGGDTDANCLSVLPQDCTNANKFVMIQRIQFGNGSLAAQRPSSFGDPTVALRPDGVIPSQTAITDAGAAVPSPQQAELQALWQTNSGPRTPLVDSQIIYAVEAYFESPDLALGALGGNGVYARWFF